jgi:hypothetical protein
LLLFLLAYFPQAKVQSRIKNYLVKATQVRARLPRQELLAIGMKPGPAFDKILERVFFDQLDGKIKTHQQLEKELRSLSGIKEPPPPPPATKTPKAGPLKRKAAAAKAVPPAPTPAPAAKTPKQGPLKRKAALVKAIPPQPTPAPAAKTPKAAPLKRKAATVKAVPPAPKRKRKKR